MWGMSFVIYFALKLLSWSTRGGPAPVWKHLAYLFAWPGMDVDVFLGIRKSRLVLPTTGEWFFAMGKMLLGAALVWLVVPAANGSNALIVGWIAMIGIVLILHCGLFHLLSCVWRNAGIPAAPIMIWPVLSQSLSEFWGRRWNMAFRDLTYKFLFLPLTPRLGPIGAMLVGFVISGLIHDAVISGPAGGGWGLPTCFFILQAAGILFERSRWGKGMGLGRGAVGWMYCVLLIVVPSPLLFHEPFITNVILPFLAAIGATS